MRRRGLLILGLALHGLSALGWALTGDQTHDIARHLALWTLAWVGLGCAWLGARGLSAPALGAVLAAALGCRVLLLGAPPLLSDDVYRYVWEGRIQLHGGNPYAFADRPAAERWTALRDDVWRGVNWKEYAAIYPPLWQLAARAVVRVHDSVMAMKAFLVACEVACWAVLGLALARRGLPRERLLLAALHPLALCEIAGSGHNESFGLLGLGAALLALDAGRSGAAASLAALAFQAKLLPGLIAAGWARRLRARDVLLASALAGLLVLPYASAGPDLLRSLQAYGREWRFNETGFALLALLPVGRVWPGRIALALLAALACALAWKRAEPAEAGLALVGAWLLVMPSVLPWYALWLLPFLVLLAPHERAAAGHAALAALHAGAFAFTATVALAYLVYPGYLAGGAWQVSWGVRALEYGPCVLLAGWQALRQRAARQS